MVLSGLHCNSMANLRKEVGVCVRFGIWGSLMVDLGEKFWFRLKLLNDCMGFINGEFGALGLGP